MSKLEDVKIDLDAYHDPAEVVCACCGGPLEVDRDAICYTCTEDK